MAILALVGDRILMMEAFDFALREPSPRRMHQIWHLDPWN